MRRPPFKLDGRQATLAWTSFEGRERVSGDRACRMLARVAEQVVAGTGHGFRVRLAGSRTWHPVGMTEQEARDYLACHFTTRGMLRRAEAIRSRRERKGRAR